MSVIRLLLNKINMKTAGLILCGLCLAFSNLSAQVTQSAVPSMAGWNYYGGDEFNGNKIDESKWGVYGDPKYNYNPSLTPTFA
jgi:glycoside hydrolase, family 16